MNFDYCFYALIVKKQMGWCGAWCLVYMMGFHTVIWRVPGVMRLRNSGASLVM